MLHAITTPFFVQGFAMFVDEFYFHRKRGLPRWERIGHPLDTLTVLACFAYLFFTPKDSLSPSVYVGLAAFSSLFVTKDEWVHQKECNASEQWLHAVLFVLHPVVLYSAFVCAQADHLKPFLWVQFALAGAFFLYQWVYWNFLAPPAVKAKEDVDNSIYNQLGDRWYTAFDDPVALLRAESKVKVPWVSQRLSTLGTGARVLDVGCGAGFLANALAQEGHVVTGVDLSEESLKVAAKHDATASVKYLAANAYELPFPDASFDAVTCMDFLEHVPEPDKVISEVSRVLKPGGLLFFHTFNRNMLSHLIIIKLVEWLVKNTPRNMHVIDLFIQPRELEAMCQKAGLQCTEWTGIKPRFSTLKASALFTGIVPEGFEFELTPSLRLSYMGCARKME